MPHVALPKKSGGIALGSNAPGADSGWYGVAGLMLNVKNTASTDKAGSGWMQRIPFSG